MNEDKTVFEENQLRDRHAIYWSLGALVSIILAFLLMFLLVRTELVEPGGILSVDIEILVHEPALRDVALQYRIFNTKEMMVLSSNDVVQLTLEDTFVPLHKELAIPETFSSGVYMFKGYVLSQEEPYVISEFQFYILAPWIIWFFSSFSFLILFTIAFICLLFAWRSYIREIDDDSEQYSKKEGLRSKILSTTMTNWN